MTVHYCDWCGARVEKPIETEVEFRGLTYDLCSKHHEEFEEMMLKIMKRFEAKKAPNP